MVAHIPIQSKDFGAITVSVLSMVSIIGLAVSICNDILTSFVSVTILATFLLANALLKQFGIVRVD